MANKNWYKLDNAGQLFPMISNKNDTNTFRLACVLKEDIDPELLNKAVIISLDRFPTFRVKLKKGYFWYYLEENDALPVVKEESPYYCVYNDFESQNGFPFNISYNKKRLSIEVFHAISDGTGGMEFLKAIIFNYLTLKGYEIKNNGEILTEEIESLVDESEDSFKYNYDKEIKKNDNEGKAFKIKGSKYYGNWQGAIHTICDLASLKEASKKYDATITEYLSAVILNSIYINYIKGKKQKHPARLFIPVNARKYFTSKTLRNFALFIRTETKFNENTTFETILEHVKQTFKEEVSKEKMLARIKTNMKLEKNPIVRIVPLALKRIIVKIAYKILGTNANTMSFSNLGIVKMPQECSKYIDHFEFANVSGRASPINTTAITYNNITVISFTTCVIERKFESSVIKQLLNDNVKLIIETNDLEVEHEKM